MLSWVLLSGWGRVKGYLQELQTTKLPSAAVSPDAKQPFLLSCVAQRHFPSQFRSCSGWGRGKGVPPELLLTKLRYTAVSPDPYTKQPFLSSVAYSHAAQTSS